ncbi:amino acid adenylation domain-containing protein [Microbulbifer sp. MKSA007]|nr:amino acid adenylation domain-containing protein [Microbulbifer sp. MKSA007]
MTAMELIDELQGLGVELWTESEQLRFRAAKGLLSEQHKQRLREHKLQIIEILSAAQTAAGNDQDLGVVVEADRENRHEPFPLSDVQTAYLLGRQNAFGYGGVACHGYLELEYPGLNPKGLQEAWNQLIERHPMLRAVIEQEGYQRVLPQVPHYEMKSQDLTGLDEDALELALESVRDELGHRNYPIGEWPMFELRHSRTDKGHIVHFSMDALIADWASAGILFNELDLLLSHPGTALPPMEIDFRDYLLAERSLLDSQGYQNDRRYWLDRLEQLPPAPELPVLPPAAEAESVRFNRHHYRLDTAHWQTLKQRASTAGLTASVAVLAAYGAVLQRWSRQPCFSLNLTLLNRLPLHPQVNQLIGDFTSVSVLAIGDSNGKTFRDWAAGIGEQLFSDIDHRLFSGVEVLREMSRARGPEAALMPVVFTSAIGLGDTEKPASGRKSGRGITQTPQVTLDCQVRDDADGLEINWDVRQGVFPSGLVEDMFAAFTGLLNELAAGGDGQWLGKSPVSLPEWQQQERHQVNQTDGPVPSELLHQGVFAQAAATPEATAIIDSNGSVSYGDLAKKAAGIAKSLSKEGFQLGGRVAIAMPKGREQIAATLGVLLAGGIYLPLDAAQPEIRLNKLLLSAEAEYVLTLSDLASQIKWPSEVQVISVDTLAPETEIPVASNGDPEQLAYVIYTSGSTGEPKGVMINHRAALNTVLDINRRFEVGPGDRILGLAQLSFDLSVYDIFGPLAVGAILVLPDPARGADPSHWAEVMDEHRVTLWNSVPAQLQMLATYLDTEPRPLSEWRLAMLSGDWIPVTLPEHIRRHVPALNLIGMGGATEAAIWSNYHRIERVDPAWSSIPYGVPLTNQGFRVLDSQLRDAPVWVAGELMITGLGLADGYLGDAALSEQKFFSHPVDGQRLYRTGDLGRYLPGGELEFLGREDGQVKIRGHRIELGEVESALLAHPAVSTAAAVIERKEGDSGADLNLLGFVESRRMDDAEPAVIDPELVNSVRHFAHYQAGEPEAVSVGDYVQVLEQAALLSMLHGLMGLGAFTDCEQGYSAEEILSLAEVHEKHHWLVRRWLDLLVNAKLLGLSAISAGAEEKYTRTQAVDISAVDEAWKRVEQGIESGFCNREFLQYHRDHVELLPQLLANQQNPFELLFPQGDQQVALSLYRDDLIARFNNAAVAALINRIAAQSDRGLTVLELGAGTGATSASVIPMLDGYDVDYLFTDMTAFFLTEARRQFKEWPWVRFGLMDLNTDYRAQGLAPNSADVILCAGMLNSTRDPEAAIASAVELLAPGGWLILTEPTVDHAHILLTQGFMMDPAGDDRACGATKFFSIEKWQSLLKAHGAGQVLCLPEDEHPLSAFGMNLLAAQMKTDRQYLSAGKLRDFLANRLPAHMVPAHLQVLDQLPLTANGKVDRKMLAGWRPATGDAQEAAHSEQMDPLETALCKLWANALGLDNVGRQDSFFDLGGDSLIMARVAGRLLEEIPEAKSFTYDALLRHMLNGPTVAALARALRVEPGAVAEEQADTDSENLVATTREGSNSLMVPFSHKSEGKGASKEEAPVRIMFHAALGTLDYFQHLGKALAAQDLGPVIGIAVANTETYLSIDAKELIERTADDYAQRIIDEGYQRCQLIGYCLGGLLATEVSRRLLERGVDVIDLSLIDSIPMFVDTDEELAFEAIFAPNLNLDPVKAVFGEHIESEDISRAIETLMQKHSGRVPAGAMAELDGDAGLKAVAEAVRQRSQLTQEQRLADYTELASAQAGVPVEAAMIPGLFRVCRHSMRAACFDLPPYIGDMTYLRCQEEQSFGVTAGVGHMAAPYWQDVCLGDFELIDVPGNHFSVMEPPQVATVVEHLAKPLQRGKAGE